LFLKQGTFIVHHNKLTQLKAFEKWSFVVSKVTAK